MINKEKVSHYSHLLQKFKSHLYFLSMVWLSVFSAHMTGYTQSKPSPLFQESTELLPDFEDSYGVVFSDLNNDNWPDIYVVRFRNLNRLFINPGNGGIGYFADFLFILFQRIVADIDAGDFFLSLNDKVFTPLGLAEAFRRDHNTGTGLFF